MAESAIRVKSLDPLDLRTSYEQELFTVGRIRHCVEHVCPPPKARNSVKVC
jgi:hypothetical protein